MSASPSKSQGAADAPEGNIYASKSELLEWVNGLLQLQLSKLEQFASGAVFCQVLDAYFQNVIPMNKVNYHASNEYEALVNYKVLQQGFTGINLTRDIHISKLSRGSRVELLELLQYLYKYLLKFKAMEGYNGRERRAIAMKGGIDFVPVPSWMSQSQAAGRSAMNKSSGNWSQITELQQSNRSGLRASGSFNPSPSHTTGRRSSTASPDKDKTSSSPDKEERGAARRPCAPARIPTAVATRRSDTTSTAPTAAATANTVAAGASVPVAAATTKHTDDKAEDDESGVAVFQVLAKEEEASAVRAMADDLGSTTRLVIPEDAISSRMVRPLSPGSRSQLEVCLAVVAEAIEVLNKSCSNMQQISSGLSSCSDSYVYRGKISSLQNSAGTTAAHVRQMLIDITDLCSRKADGTVDGIKQQAEKLEQELKVAAAQLKEHSQELQAATAARPVSGQQKLNMQLTQLQKQLASTAALDGSLRNVGAAYASLLGRVYKEGAAMAAHFLVDTLGNGSSGGVVTSKVLKLGDCSMKQLRNGDIYKGRYQGSRKNGEGSYFFVNADVYEGEFKDDRMAGSGVYSFSPEGRYEGDWSGAVYEGFGSETFSKGSTYLGQYSGGLRHGWGMCRFFNGDFYQGQWMKGLREGRGMQQCTDDSNYVGDYNKGKRHGYGVYSFPNGDQYLGKYEDDIPQGYGVYVFGSGQKYEGHWEKGKKHGWSIYTVETGQRWAGSWVEGKPQWVHPLPQDGNPDMPEAAPEVADNLTHAFAACKNAQEAGVLAQGKLEAHWAQQGEVQQGLSAAAAGAAHAAQTAQAARQRAQLLAARLDAAAALVDDGSRSAQIKLVAQPVIAHQLQDLSIDGA